MPQASEVPELHSYVNAIDDRSGVCGVCWPRNDVDQGPEHRNEQDHHCPSELRTSVVITSTEVVDEAPDDEEDHQEDPEEHKHRPEEAQEGKVIGQHGDFLSS
jgi:hypothetical protein